MTVLLAGSQLPPPVTAPVTAAGGEPTLEIIGRRGIIRLNRPTRHNRLERADLAALDAILGVLETRPDLRSVVLTASGPSFSSGYDITALNGQTGPAIRFDQVVDRLEALPLPTICAFNGNVYGGATDLALACAVLWPSLAPPPPSAPSCWPKRSMPRRCWRWAISTGWCRPANSTTR